MTVAVLSFQSPHDNLMRTVDAIRQLLSAAGWESDETLVRSALPHGQDTFTGQDIYGALKRLHLPLELDPDPPHSEKPRLVIFPGGDWQISTGPWQQTKARPAAIVQVLDSDDADLVPAVSTFGEIFAGLRANYPALLGATFLINVLGLAAPLTVMTVYDIAIGSGSLQSIGVLCLGLSIALSAELWLRTIRSRYVITLAARLESRVGRALLYKLVTFPLDALVRTDAYQQRARLRQLESIREALRGPIIQAALDLPFLVIFGAALFLMAPSVALIAIGIALCHAAIFSVTAPLSRRRQIALASLQTDYEKRQVNVIENRSDIAMTGGASLWEGRLADDYAMLEDARTKAQDFSSLVDNILQLVLLLAGLCASFQAAKLVIAGELSLGGFVGLLILIWRFLQPIQTVSRGFEQLLDLYANIGQINTMLKMAGEPSRNAAPLHQEPVKPPVIFDQVSLRFPNTVLPALLGVSLQLEHGKILSLSGTSLSGKTILAELIAGLHAPSSGRIILNGSDIRQIPVDDLRRSIAFYQQHNSAFHGTIFQNLQFAKTTATTAQMWEALEEAGIAEQVAALPDGLHTRLNEDTFRSLPAELRFGIVLAQAFVRPGPIFIFDQPTLGLSDRQAGCVRMAIGKRRTRGAVLLISNAPDDLAIADKHALLAAGRLVVNERGKAARQKVLRLMGFERELL